MTTKNAQDIANLTFEQALKELEGIVRKLEGGQGELESAIAEYHRRERRFGGLAAQTGS